MFILLQIAMLLAWFVVPALPVWLVFAPSIYIAARAAFIVWLAWAFS
jgi:hypothetical protein